MIASILIGGDTVKIGFIGAGRVGVTMGKHFITHAQDLGKYKVIGYYDSCESAMKEAQEITETKILSKEEIIRISDILFITVTDGAIEEVWNQVSKYDIKGKIICHCSGALSSEVFSNIEKLGAYGYSVHPLFACSSKEESYKDISKALFTIEGSIEKLEEVKQMIEDLGNKVQVIDAKYKVKYHAAAVMASNQVIGLIKAACDLLKESGFSEENALEAIKPLIYGNIDNVYRQGIKEALTGPVVRDDKETIFKHIEALEGTTKEIYKELTIKLYDIVAE